MGSPEEKAYTIREIAALTGFSRQTISRMFEKERGVLVINRPEEMHKRRYRSIRIPRFVFDRVIRQLSV